MNKDLFLYKDCYAIIIKYYGKFIKAKIIDMLYINLTRNYKVMFKHKGNTYIRIFKERDVIFKQDLLLDKSY